MIEYIYGDITEFDHAYIAHGVNCQGKMNSGVAKAIRNKYPMAYEGYMDYIKFNGNKETLLGKVNPVKIGDITVINCFTQQYYGYDGKRYVSYDAIDKCMALISYILIPFPNEYIAMPKIGSGLGGGDWKVIEAIINSRIKQNLVKIYYQ